ncbi:hypothetical protein [Cytobacillus praedii]|nr:hypothetical protein [Cytobacillus praedii]
MSVLSIAVPVEVVVVLTIIISKIYKDKDKEDKGFEINNLN